MKHRPFTSRLLIPALLLVVAGLYSAPGMLARTSPHFPPLYGVDGAYYAQRLQAALKGDTALSCPQDPTLATDDTFIPRQTTVGWAALLRPFAGEDVFSALRITYLALPALIALAYVFLLVGVTGSLPIALGVTLWVMIEARAVHWQPLSLDVAQEMTYFRYANPMLLGAPMVAAFAALAWLMRRRAADRGGIAWNVAAAALFLGLSFYTQAYYWSWAGVTMGLFAAILWLQRKRAKAGLVLAAGAGSLALGGKEVWHSFSMFSPSYLTEAIHRVGCMIENSRPYFLLPKGFVLTVLAYQWICRKSRDWQWALVTSGAVAGWLLLNQNVVTGVSNQEHHYFRAMVIAYAMLAADCLRRLAHWPRWRALPAWAGPALASVALVAVLGKGVSSAVTMAGILDGPRSFGPVAVRYRKTLEKLRALPPGGSVLADPRLDYALAIRGERPLFIHHYLIHCPISDAELFDRWALLFKLRGRTPEQYAKHLQDYLDTGIPWWFYGAPAAFKGPRDRNLPEDLRAVAAANTEAYGRLDARALSASLQGQHGLPGYVLSTPEHEFDPKTLGEVFRLEQVFEVADEGTRLWKVIRLEFSPPAQ